MTSHPDAANVRAYRALAATPSALRTGTLLAALGFAVVTVLVPVVDGVHLLPSGHDLVASAQALAGITGDVIESVKAAGAALHDLAADAEGRLNLPLIVMITLGAQVVFTAALAVTGAQPARVMLTVAGLINVLAVTRVDATEPAVWDAIANGLLMLVLAWLPSLRSGSEPRLVIR